MTIFGLYDSPDSVMEAVQKYPHQRLVACSPDRLLHSPDLHRLHLCRDSISPKGRGGRIVYQPVVLDGFFGLRASPGGKKMHRFVHDDRFSIICNSLYQPPALLLHANNGRFPYVSMSSTHIA